MEIEANLREAADGFSPYAGVSRHVLAVSGDGPVLEACGLWEDFQTY